MASPQTLSIADRRIVADWAADCAEHVLAIFEAAVPDDRRPRALIERTRAFARGDADTATEIRQRFTGGVPASEVGEEAALAAARAAGQAVAVSHMGAHALGAAAYAVQAVGLDHPEQPQAVDDEIAWQVAHMRAEVRRALGLLPRIGTDRSGPLGPGLLTTEPRGSIIDRIQATLDTAAARPPD